MTGILLWNSSKKWCNKVLIFTPSQLHDISSIFYDVLLKKFSRIER